MKNNKKIIMNLFKNCTIAKNMIIKKHENFRKCEYKVYKL